MAKIEEQNVISAQKINKKEKKKIKKDKRKLNLSNYKATKYSTITWIYILRLISIAMLIFIPVFYAFAIGYDPGIITMTQYVFSLTSDWFISFLQKIFVGSSPYEIIILIVPLFMWFWLGVLIFFWFFLPFLRRKSRRGRGFLAFRLFFWPLLSGGLIWAFPHLFQFFPGYWEGAFNADPLAPGLSDSEIYFIQMLQSWDPLSPWMIVIQIMNLIFVAVSINIMHECELMRKKKLRYTDLMIDNSKTKSMASYVLSGGLEFGTMEKNDINKAYKYLKSNKNENKDLIGYISKLKGQVEENEESKAEEAT